MQTSSFSCSASRRERRLRNEAPACPQPGRYHRRSTFRKTLCSAKRAYLPQNTPFPARVRTTNLGPFGEVIRATGPMARANPFRFSTKYQDDETDLLYYGYRYCNASTGRWLSRDPAGEAAGGNLYGFAYNDSMHWVDAEGNSVLSAASPAPPPATSVPRTATRSVKPGFPRAQHNFGIYQVVIQFDLVITDASSQPVVGTTVSENVEILRRYRLISGPPATGSGATDKRGSVTDTYAASFCGSSGFVEVRQTVNVGTYHAVFNTTIDAPGTWAGTLLAVFH